MCRDYFGQDALPTLLTPGDRSVRETDSGIPGPWQARSAFRKVTESILEAASGLLRGAPTQAVPREVLSWWVETGWGGGGGRTGRAAARAPTVEG